MYTDLHMLICKH